MAETMTDADLHERVSRLEEEIASLKAVRTVPLEPADDEQIAERVLTLITTKVGDNGHAPAGLIPVSPVRFADPPPGATALPPNVGLRAWLVGMLAEWRLIVRMYFDPRYRLSRVAQFGVPVVLLLFAFSYFFFNYTAPFSLVPVLPQVLDRLAGIVLAFVLYKLLAREAVRYKHVIDYLAAYGR